MTAPTPEDDRERYRVAVTVFAECEGVDASDAASAVAMMLRQKIHQEGGAISFMRPDGVSWRAEVHEVMEAGMALGNGYLWAGVTSKAFPRPDRD